MQWLPLIRKRVTKYMLRGIIVGAIIFVGGMAVFFMYYWNQPQVQSNEYKLCVTRALQASKDYYVEYCKANQLESCSSDQLTDEELAAILSFYEEAEAGCRELYLQGSK